MDPTKIEKKEPEAAKKILGYKCTIDGNHWVFFNKKKCRYCLSVTDVNEKARLQAG